MLEPGMFTEGCSGAALSIAADVVDRGAVQRRDDHRLAFELGVHHPATAHIDTHVRRVGKKTDHVAGPHLVQLYRLTTGCQRLDWSAAVPTRPGMAASHHSCVLARDARATGTYQAVGAKIEVVN
jgi:hypothetical protein